MDRDQKTLLIISKLSSLQGFIGGTIEGLFWQIEHPDPEVDLLDVAERATQRVHERMEELFHD